MKKLLFGHILLNVYLLAIVQPCLPIFDYLINYDYIAAELCRNQDKPELSCAGKCFLADQLIQQGEGDSGDPQPLPPSFEMERLLTLLKINDWSIKTLELRVSKEIFSSTSSLKTLNIPPPVRPPRSALFSF